MKDTLLKAGGILDDMKAPYQIRRNSERKYYDHGWLKTYHTFSFGNYYDPNFMRFRDLRVINEDRVAPERGFPAHDHSDMEIISVVLEGELAHQDSSGGESVILANEIQAMSAGTGITHSEYNPSSKYPVHFLQIWILPDKKGAPPRYQKFKLPESVLDQWILVASPDGRDQSLMIHQDAEVFSLHLRKGGKQEIRLAPERYGWVQVARGDLLFGKDLLKAGDGVAIGAGTTLSIEGKSPSQILFFDLK